MQRKGVALDEIYDARALRVVIDDGGVRNSEEAIAACYQVQLMAHQLYHQKLQVLSLPLQLLSSQWHFPPAGTQQLAAGGNRLADCPVRTAASCWKSGWVLRHLLISIRLVLSCAGAVGGAAALEADCKRG